MKRLLAICLLMSSASLAHAGSWGFNNFSWSPNMSWGNSPSWGYGPQGFSWGPSWGFGPQTFGWGNQPYWGGMPMMAWNSYNAPPPVWHYYSNPNLNMSGFSWSNGDPNWHSQQWGYGYAFQPRPLPPIGGTYMPFPPMSEPTPPSAPAAPSFDINAGNATMIPAPPTAAPSNLPPTPTTPR
jgi:hypothetical protein